MNCLVCGSDNLRFRPALLAPFLAELAKLGPTTTSLVTCRKCSFHFSERRLNEQENQLIYGEYRGENYLKVRNSHEPWYTKDVNDSIGFDEIEIRSRQERLRRLLCDFAEWEFIVSVLDYGGDRGQFIPPNLGTTRWLYDVSTSQPVEGVYKVENDLSLMGRRFDLVMLCHVLEHVSDPVDLIRTVRRNVDEDGCLYVEVPYEIPFYWCWSNQTYLNFLSKHPKLLRLVDFYSTACRVLTGIVPPLGFVKISEHINLFSPASLRETLVRAGFDVVTCDLQQVNGPAGIGTVISALAHPRT